MYNSYAAAFVIAVIVCFTMYIIGLVAFRIDDFINYLRTKEKPSKEDLLSRRRFCFMVTTLCIIGFMLFFIVGKMELRYLERHSPKVYAYIIPPENVPTEDEP